MCPLARLGRWLVARLCPRRRRLLFLAIVTDDGCIFIGEFHMSKISQSGILLALIAVTASGAQVAAPEGQAQWSFSGDASVATLTPAEDGKTATLVGNGTAGVVSVSVTLNGFTKTDSFEFDAAVPAPPPAPVDPIVGIDWTVTSLEAPVPDAPPAAG